MKSVLRRRLAKLEARMAPPPKPRYDRIVAVSNNFPGWKRDSELGREPVDDNPWLRNSP